MQLANLVFGTKFDVHDPNLLISNLFLVVVRMVYLLLWWILELPIALCVEGRHGVLFMSNCLLLVGECSSRCLGLLICVLGGFL